MKVAFFLVSMLCFGTNAFKLQETRRGAIKKVVKMLEEMLETSKAEGEEEKEVYGKFKCYCDDNTKEKTTSIEDLTKTIGLLQSKIEGLQGSNGELSSQVAKLKQEMDENELARETATTMREKEGADFAEEETDLKAAISQLGQAIDVLASIGSDQTAAEGADHKKFMAGYKEKSLASLRSSVKQALLAATSFLTPAEHKQVSSFLQEIASSHLRAPFTGSYAAQSGGITGILKNMKETFESNLKSAQDAETAAKTAHEKFIATKETEFETMKALYDEKEALMGGNDGDLSSKKDQLADAIKQKADDEEFLATLTTSCKEKAKEYEDRKLFRANENAAISKAISILNSEAAYDTFGKVKAADSAGMFLQVSGVSRRHQDTDAMVKLLRALRGSRRLAGVAALLRAGNPFEKVLKEIENMKKVISEEGVLDKKQLDWCKSERDLFNGDLEKKTSQIEELKASIQKLTESIEDPETGFKHQIAEAETSLEENKDNQKKETENRRDENKAYQKNVENLVEAKELLGEAIAVLKEYYDQLKKENAELLQRESPEEPETWSGAYAGQKEAGAKVIEQIEFILEETKKEETTAHETENEAQADYEDSMKQLKEDEENLLSSLADLKKDMADAELEIQSSRAQLDATEEEKISIERYLEKIKPGCDFITSNFDIREENRKTELDSLDNAVTLLKDTPAYKNAAASKK